MTTNTVMLKTEMMVSLRRSGDAEKGDDGGDEEESEKEEEEEEKEEVVMKRIPGVPIVVREADQLASSFGHLGIGEPAQYQDDQNMKMPTTIVMLMLMTSLCASKWSITSPSSNNQHRGFPNCVGATRVVPSVMVIGGHGGHDKGPSFGGEITILVLLLY